MSQSTLQKQMQAKDWQNISAEEGTSVPLKPGSPKDVQSFFHTYIIVGLFCFVRCCEVNLSDAAKKIRDRVGTPPPKQQINEEEEEVDPLQLMQAGATSIVTVVVF